MTEDREQLRRQYPEHDKLQAVSSVSQEIGAFLDWLPSIGIHLAEWREFDDAPDELWAARWSINELLAEYFDVDLKALEREKRAMLEAQRELNRADAKAQERRMDAAMEQARQEQIAEHPELTVVIPEGALRPLYVDATDEPDPDEDAAWRQPTAEELQQQRAVLRELLEGASEPVDND